MAVKIGRAYKSDLAKLKQLIDNLRRGGWQEGITVQITGGIMPRARCYYCSCGSESISADRIIVLNYDAPINNKKRYSSRAFRVEKYPFHFACIEDLLADERVPFLN